MLMYPLMGEKATILRESQNRLTFIVNNKATKRDIKESIETLYDAKVVKVNVMTTSDGRKKAHIKLDPKYDAEEISSHFGVL